MPALREVEPEDNAYCDADYGYDNFGYERPSGGVEYPGSNQK